jgi:hypothetical protein
LKDPVQDGKLRAAGKSAAPATMKEKINPDDAKLSALLRHSRSSPSLPPRFQESVWRRIEDSEAAIKPDTWPDALAILVLRPRFAAFAVAILVTAGALLGVREGSLMAQQDARSQYISAVAPVVLR